ncbi:immunity protein YezG family protein [Lacticaseibacillus mingshuiensis]|uniref:Immunity protein YezG family protein n=1 Tax=Lacticaseibacillus mingshuiensis TaxID=2799574 RepID=A0ABW4CG51_9LACO|nr:immunity protein YezG family protein [Lacticaseibacillus mingshuiensis]
MDETAMTTATAQMMKTATDVIPVGWHDVVLGANISADEQVVLFFFYTAANDPTRYLRGISLPWDYGGDKKLFDAAMAKLREQALALQKQVVAAGDPAFHELVLHAVYQAEMKTTLGYVDWAAANFSPDDQMMYFQATYLGTAFSGWGANHKLKKMTKLASKGAGEQ